jgi:hypothetical protein
LARDLEEMKTVTEEIWEYQSCPKDALATLRFYYKFHPEDENETREKFAEQMYREVLYGGDCIRGDDGEVLVEETIEWKKEEIDDIFYYQHTGPFVRTMNRMKKIKEELMMATWHPRRIERLLELGGHEALDNFAGL